jgi:hypothetical protein
MLSLFEHLSSSLNSHDRVKLNTCLTSFYSPTQLRSGGYNISVDQARYSKREEAIENIMLEREISRGGRPPLSQQGRENVIQFLLENSTESNYVFKQRFILLCFLF